MLIEVPTPAYSIFYQWVAEVGPLPETRTLLSSSRSGPEAAARLASELLQLRQALATRPNREMRHLGPISAAYKALGLHWFSSWEESELGVREGLSTGKYDAWATAGSNGQPPRETELYLLVVHGGFAKAAALLERYAAENPRSKHSVWTRWLASGTVDPTLLGVAVAVANARPVPSDLPLFFVDSGMDGQEALARRSTAKERELSDKPVKSLPKLMTQLMAFRRGEVSRELLRKSFGAVYAQCHGHEDYSNLPEKIGVACLQGRYLDPESSPHELVEGIKTHLAMFSPKRRAAARRFVGDLEPVKSILGALEQLCQLSRGIEVQRLGGSTRIASLGE